MFDFHNHLMPGVDDGAANIDESRVGIAAMLEQGITTIVTTPHIAGSLTANPPHLERYLKRLDEAFAKLSEMVTFEFPAVRLERGVEMMLDIPLPIVEDERLRLAGSSFVLIEFPYMNIPPNSAAAIRQVKASGVTPVIAHPERYSNMASNIDSIERWMEAGACIQINAGSVVGRYGARAKKIVMHILENGWAHYMCTDYHSRGRVPMSACAAEMMERGAGEQLRTLTVTNPERLLRSEMPVDVEPLQEEQLGFWKKIFRA